ARRALLLPPRPRYSLETHSFPTRRSSDLLDEQSKKAVTIKFIELDIVNAKQLRLDPLIIHQLEELIKNEIGHLIGEDVQFRFLRSEEHTSELQSRFDLVCRLLLEKKKERH